MNLEPEHNAEEAIKAIDKTCEEYLKEQVTSGFMKGDIGVNQGMRCIKIIEKGVKKND
jgi:hypothetical protein